MGLQEAGGHCSECNICERYSLPRTAAGDCSNGLAGAARYKLTRRWWREGWIWGCLHANLDGSTRAIQFVQGSCRQWRCAEALLAGRRSTLSIVPYKQQPHKQPHGTALQQTTSAFCPLLRTSGKFSSHQASAVLSAALRAQQASFCPGVTVPQLGEEGVPTGGGVVAALGGGIAA